MISAIAISGVRASQRVRGSRQQKEACCVAVSNEYPDGASEEGKNCWLQTTNRKRKTPGVKSAFLTPERKVKIQEANRGRSGRFAT
jgi:hypothetical protein